MVRIDRDASGRLRGHCNEYGNILYPTEAQAQRYAFQWREWAQHLRRHNRLDGSAPVQGAGCLFVGEGIVAGRKYGLLAIAPGCHRADDVILPDGARNQSRALVGLFLGEIVNGVAVDVALGATTLTQDLITIDVSALERALDEIPLIAEPKDGGYLMFSNESSRGRQITQAEYDHLHRPEALRKSDLVIDLLLCKVWRKGRPRGMVLDSKGRSTGKRLGDRGVRLLASYVKRPGIPMMARDTEAYQGVLVEPRSAAIMLATVRRSTHATAFLKSGAHSSEPGETTYVFTPPSGMTWRVFAPLLPK